MEKNKSNNFYADDFVEWAKYNHKEIDIENENKNKLSVSSIRPTWNEMFMEIAEVVAKRSKDPHTRVGSVIVKNNHIVGIGYNAEPKNFNYSFNWNTSEKYDYVIHAELNAIANATSLGVDIRNSDIYVTVSPCPECMKLLLQYEIKNVFYLKEYKTIDKTKFIAKHSNINLIKMEYNNE